MMIRKIREVIGMPKAKAKIIRIESITPGMCHAWCDTDQGRIRKPISAISKNVISEYRNGVMI